MKERVGEMCFDGFEGAVRRVVKWYNIKGVDIPQSAKKDLENICEFFGKSNSEILQVLRDISFEMNYVKKSESTFRCKSRDKRSNWT